MNRGNQKADRCEPLADAVRRGEVTLIARARGQYPGTRIPEGRLPGLRSIGCWDAVGPQNWGLPMHRNEGIEICFLINGECRFATDEGEWMLQAGDITVTRPWQRHCLGDPYIRPCRLFWMILDVEALDQRSPWQFPGWVGPDHASRQALLRLFRKNQRCHFPDEGERLKPLMKHVAAILGDDSPLAMANLASLVNRLLLEVGLLLSAGIRSSKQDPQGLDQTIRQFFRGLEASVEKAAEPWSLNGMAHVCRVGKSYLTVSCRRIFNATPSEQLNRIRLHHARDLLIRQPDHSITDIAFTVGFNSSQYFASRFRRQFGCTPQGYRAGTRR